jgi:hypothetical protein
VSNVQSKVDHRLSPDIAQRLHNSFDRTSTSTTVATAARTTASRKHQQQHDETGSSGANRGAAA